MGIKCVKSADASKNLPAFTYRNMIKYVNTNSVHEHYEFVELIGTGSYAQVYKAKCIQTGSNRAIKKLNRKKSNKVQQIVMNEYDILKEMDHPNILKIFEIYEQPDYYHIVSELCPGKQLFNILKEKKYFSEQEAAGILYQVLSAVNYLHSKNIMHRDLKPENIMYDPLSGILKLIDFGSALRYDNQQIMQRRRIGTTYYIAPQVIDRMYNNKCDTWSLGVTLYILLCGQPPFKGKTDQDVLDSIKSGQYNFKKSIWQSISSQAKMLITQMLIMDLNLRPTASQLMKSEWFSKYNKHHDLDQADHIFLRKALSNMQKFKQTKTNNIQGAVFVFIVNFVKGPQEQIELQRCFKQLDINGDGLLSLDQLTQGIEKFLRITNKQAKSMAHSIFRKIDTNNSGFIDYSQFIVAANNIQLTATEQNLGMAFDYMDEDKNGWLSIIQIQSRLGDNISSDAYEQMLKQFQKNKQGQINKSNFISMMTKIMNKV